MNRKILIFKIGSTKKTSKQYQYISELTYRKPNKKRGDLNSLDKVSKENQLQMAAKQRKPTSDGSQTKKTNF